MTSNDNDKWLEEYQAKALVDIDKWRVVGVDNYARENVSDYLHSSYNNEAEAEAKVEELNANSGPEPSRWYRVYKPGTKLYLFEP